MRMDIDRVRCDGHGLCAQLLPGRIVLDEWGYPIVHDPEVAGDDAADVRRTVAACPSLALRLTTTDRRARR